MASRRNPSPPPAEGPPVVDVAIPNSGDTSNAPRDFGADVPGILRLDPDTCFTAERFARIMGMTEAEVVKRIYAKAIPAVRGFKKGQWLIPTDLLRERIALKKHGLHLGPLVDLDTGKARASLDPASPLARMLKDVERKARHA